MLAHLLLRPLLDEFNRQLLLDPARAARFAPLAGRTLSIGPGIGDLTVEVLPDGSLSFSRAPAEASVQLPLAALPRLLAGDLAAYRELRLGGDSELAQAFAKTLADCPPDPNEALANWVGDVAAERIGQQIGALAQWPQHAANRLASSLTDYCQQEIGLLPSPVMLQDWLSSCDALRDDIERLSKRVERLEQHSSSPAR